MALEVHPVADLFPMLADDELQELADDIKQRGLLQPIVLDADGRILDGRNRYAACGLAGIEPTFVTKPDATATDALAYNGQRRDLTAGKRAIIAAQASKLEDLKGSDVARTLRIAESRVSEARTILEYEPALAGRVLAGSMPLVDAYEVAKERRAEVEADKPKLGRLRDEAPDLLSLVEDERLSLDGAIAELDLREEKGRQEAERRRLEEEEQRCLDDRITKLPDDLAERVNAGSLAIAEAESVVKQRVERLKAWAEKIRTGLETLTRMVGNPVPAELKELLTDEEIANLVVVVVALENGELR